MSFHGTNEQCFTDKQLQRSMDSRKIIANAVRLTL